MESSKKEQETKIFDFSKFWEKFGTLSILLFLIILFSLMSPFFFTWSNLTQIIVQSSIFMLIGMGELFAILTAGIDLSVGSILALTGVVTAKLMVTGIPIWLSIIIGIFVGALLGAINGLLVALTGLHPFIITLGTMNIYRGLTLVLTDARPIFNYPYEYNLIFSGSFYGIPNILIIVAVTALIFAVFTKYTTWARNIYALGGNKEAAWLSGTRIKLTTILAFTLSGLLSGIAGLAMIARVGAAEPLSGSGYELFAIASTVIGGTSFFGGVGNVVGTLLGALVIGVINNALNIFNVPTFYQQILTGLIIVSTVYANKVLIRRGE
ncbi:allose ABC transporter [Petrotoga sp. 9PWA.NaAc.5.4]|uniref:ABC transporter permease subunit n=1 Tax=Petrotoga sp. 9PWA.NaAc.5.4 TaxID=1434328 RepID=UPI000CB56934|nr:allose ABC transporter [Petrotoga sp. 9PWA.NaAc.5.4]PNR96609.1 cytochrome C6 [Petrotoga sp. 9PWA.NaAc.5.4]